MPIRPPEQSESSSIVPARVPTSQRSPEPVPPSLIGKQPIQRPITGTNNLTNLQLQELALLQHSRSEALWCQAYLSLKGREPELFDDLEQALGVDKRHCRLAGDLSGYLHQRLSQQDGNRLAIKLAGKSINIRAIGESIIGFVSATKEFISLAASSEPHAALAWAGVSLLFPVRPAFFCSRIITQTTVASAVPILFDSVLYRPRFVPNDKLILFIAATQSEGAR